MDTKLLSSPRPAALRAHGFSVVKLAGPTTALRTAAHPFTVNGRACRMIGGHNEYAPDYCFTLRGWFVDRIDRDIVIFDI